MDGELLFEQANLNFFRAAWLNKDIKITGVFRSKRYVRYTSVLEKITRWCSNIPPDESITNFELDDVMVLADFSRTF